MTDFTIDPNTPTTRLTLAAVAAKIPPAIIVAAAALSAYQAAPILVEHFYLNSWLHVAGTYSGVAVLPTPTPLRPVPPRVEPAHDEIARPAVPPVVRQEEASAAPFVIVAPRAADSAVPRGATMRPLMRGQFFRARPPRFAFARGFSGLRGMIHLGHVMPMLHMARRFGRF
jgi:hypothetical protein